MELGVFWRSLRQRWYLVLALVVVTCGATYLVAQRVGPTYEATGTVLVFPPSQAEDPTGQLSQENPYLSLGGVGQARDVVVRALTAKKVSDEFGKEYPPGTGYEIVPDYTNSAPIILFTVEAAAPDDATSALDFLMGRVPAELEKLQAGLDLPRDQQVTSVTLTQDEKPATTHKAMIRAGIMTGAVLAGAGLLLIALVDGLLASRRRGRNPEDAEDAEVAEDEPEETYVGSEHEVEHEEWSDWEPDEVAAGLVEEPAADDLARDDDETDESGDADETDETDEDEDEPPREPLRLERRRQIRGSAGTADRTVTTRMVRRRSTPGERGEAS